MEIPTYSILYLATIVIIIYSTSGRSSHPGIISSIVLNKGNNKITELRTIFQRESQNS